MIDLVGQQLGNYRLLRLIGQGGFADVYLGEHIHLTRLVAIKVLQMRLGADDSTAFLTEARVLAHLEHPHIVRVLDFGMVRAMPFLVMSYAPSGTLRQRYPKGTRVPLQDVVSYVQQVASALSYAHSQKLIHRDIKPENMLLDRQQKLLLSDFGIALLNQSSRSQKTQEVIGTAAYMAPEQLQGKPSFASDQYALGIVTYEWLSGGRPFEGSFVELFSQHIAVRPTPLSQRVEGVSSDVDAVVLRALAKDPQARFPTIAAFADALAEATTATLRKSGTFPGAHGRDAVPMQPSSPPPPLSPYLPTIEPAILTPPPFPRKEHTSGPLPARPANTSLYPGVSSHVAYPHTASRSRRRQVTLWSGLLAVLLLLSGVIAYATNNGIFQQPQQTLPDRTAPARQQSSTPGAAKKNTSSLPTPTRQSTPTPTRQPTPSPGQMLYQADWSKDLAGWKGST